MTETKDTTDTHGQEGQGWYGFDLDGTLAVYDVWRGISHVGFPVRRMVDLAKKLHDEGKTVKIVTARVAPRDDQELEPNPYFAAGVPDYVRRNDSTLKYLYYMHFWNAKTFVMDWCLRHLGFVPEITHQKDGMMIVLYDDRVKQVVPNEGILVEDLVGADSAAMREALERVRDMCAHNGNDFGNAIVRELLDHLDMIKAVAQIGLDASSNEKRGRA